MVEKRHKVGEVCEEKSIKGFCRGSIWPVTVVTLGYTLVTVLGPTVSWPVTAGYTFEIGLQRFNAGQSATVARVTF